MTTISTDGHLMLRCTCYTRALAGIKSHPRLGSGSCEVITVVCQPREMASPFLCKTCLYEITFISPQSGRTVLPELHVQADGGAIARRRERRNYVSTSTSGQRKFRTSGCGREREGRGFVPCSVGDYAARPG